MDWLIDWSIDRLTGRLIDWLIDWSTDWLTGPLTGRVRSIDRLIDWWMVDWLTDWFNWFDWQIDSTDLAAVRVGAGVGHGQDSGLGVPQLEVLVGELLAVDGFTACMHTSHNRRRRRKKKRETFNSWKHDIIKTNQTFVGTSGQKIDSRCLARRHKKGGKITTAVGTTHFIEEKKCNFSGLLRRDRSSTSILWL